MCLQHNYHLSEELRVIAKGPDYTVKRFKGFIVNGLRFRVKEFERLRKTQNIYNTYGICIE